MTKPLAAIIGLAALAIVFGCEASRPVPQPTVTASPTPDTSGFGKFRCWIEDGGKSFEMTVDDQPFGMAVKAPNVDLYLTRDTDLSDEEVHAAVVIREPQTISVSISRTGEASLTIINPETVGIATTTGQCIHVS